MDPGIQVRHLFDFSLLGSVSNGFRKSKYWTIYSIHNKDLLADSGTASWALKFDVAALFGSILALLLVLATGNAGYAAIIAVLMALNHRCESQPAEGILPGPGDGFCMRGFGLLPSGSTPWWSAQAASPAY